MAPTTRSSNAPAPAAAAAAAFFSHPSEEELIAAYLVPRVTAGTPCPFIHEADVYSLSPAALTNAFAPAVASNGDRAWYFFSAVRPKSREGQRKARTVGGDSGGCWHSEAGAKPVVVGVEADRRRRLGRRQSFSFVTTKVDGRRRARSGWLMVELGLDGADEMVLCKIYFSPRAHLLNGGTGAAAPAPAVARKRKAAADEDDVDDEDKNPSRAVRQRRLSPTIKGAAPPRANSDDDQEGDVTIQTQQDGNELVGGENNNDNAGGLTYTQLLQCRFEELIARGYFDRSDEEIRAEYGLKVFYELLDTKIPSPPPSRYTNHGYPVCLTMEDLYSTEPLWFEGNYRRGYSR